MNIFISVCMTYVVSCKIKHIHLLSTLHTYLPDNQVQKLRLRPLLIFKKYSYNDMICGYIYMYIYLD